MKKRVSAVILALLLVFVIVGCSSGGGNGYSSNSSGSPSAENAFSDSSSSSKPNEPIDDGIATGAQLASNRKLVFSSEISIETMVFDQTVGQVRRLAEDNGGYMESSNVSGKSYGDTSYRHAQFTLRVPSAAFSQTDASLAGLGNVTEHSENAQDVTDQYYDTQAELEALNIQQERLLALMEQSTTMDDLLTLEEALTEVRYRINSCTSAIKRFDGMVEYATITVYVDEVMEYLPIEVVTPTFGMRLRLTFFNAMDFVVQFGQGVLLMIVAVAPFIIVYGGIAAVIVIAIVLIVRAQKKRKLLKKEQQMKKMEADAKKQP